MKAFDKRLRTLEATAANDRSDWRPVLEGMSDDDLSRLEAIVIRREAGEPIEGMNDADLRFIAAIRIGKVEPTCAH